MPLGSARTIPNQVEWPPFRGPFRVAHALVVEGHESDIDHAGFDGVGYQA